MVFFCFVEGCPSCSDQNIAKFFRYPVEKRAQHKWLELSGRQPDAIQKSKLTHSSIRICSLHFEPSFHSWACQYFGKQSTGCRCSPKNLLPSLKLPTPKVLTRGDLQEIVKGAKRQIELEDRYSYAI